MPSSFLKQIKARLKHLSRSSAANPVSQAAALAEQPESLLHDLNPVDKYYQHRLKEHLPVFSRFALQTRSLLIRDVFARAASRGRQDLGDLLAVLETLTGSDTARYDFSDLDTYYDVDILLALADLLANSARTDLDTHAALQIYDLVYTTEGSNAFQDHQKLQYVETLGEADRYPELVGLLDEFSVHELAPLQAELLAIQTVNRTSSPPFVWVESMNELYKGLEMSQIRLSDDQALPLLDRLQANSRDYIAGPKVSIIMPTFSPGPGIRTAIRSLLEQTWTNIEIIVVDDASPLEYYEIFSELEALDRRIRIVRQKKNRGAYVARNAGLAVATGEYVTTHDDDDWSHPDKIASQVLVLDKDESLVASTSAHIRTTEHMSFQRVNMHARYMQMNYSSLMFRRSVSDQIGPWDTVNRGGDSEFITRVIENFGANSVLHLMEKPLSFSRVWTGSLTSGEMSRGYFSYSRLLYRWSFRQWHWAVAKEGKKAVKDVNESRPYAVPTTFEPGARNKDLGLFDVIYVTDFFRQAKFVDFVMNDIRALQDQGLRIGYMHLNSPQTNRPAGFPPELFDLQREGRIVQLSHDDCAETKLLLVYDASIGMFLDELRSSLVVRKGLLIDHSLPTLKGSDVRKPVFMPQVLRHLDRAFNTSFSVVGATTNDHEHLSCQLPFRRSLDDRFIWSTHVNEGPGQITYPHSNPTVGFHSYGNQYRWPSNKENFEKAYISSEYRTKLYGSLEPALEKFKDEMNHVEIIDADDVDERAFLNSIDFWVYYPHPRLEDQVWNPVLSAMRAGKVVILPERLESIYGSAAVYAEPHAVQDVILSLLSRSGGYLVQAQLGQDFVAEGFSRESFLGRLENLIA